MTMTIRQRDWRRQPGNWRKLKGGLLPFLYPSHGLPRLRICYSQHFSQMEKLEPSEIDFSQGFSQKVSKSFSVFNSLTASDHLLITFANSLDADQARQDVGPNLDPNCLTP